MVVGSADMLEPVLEGRDGGYPEPADFNAPMSFTGIWYTICLSMWCIPKQVAF
jgi:hypothetical protein